MAAQHDMDLANQTRTSFRADLNSALVALASNSWGPTEPATMFAYQFWADTTTGYLKQRNSANSAWIIKEKLSSDMLAALQTQEFTAFTTGGTSTAYTLTPAPALAALAAGQRFRVKFNATAGATPTLAISGLTAKNLKYYNNTGAKTACGATTIVANMLSDVEYDGTDYVVLNPIGGALTATNLSGGTSTVASSTTPDIFAATVGQNFSYTGSVLCTGFVAAPAANISRKGICTGAPTFTAGSNLLIDGIPSGLTLTLAPNAAFEIYAITTTQFRMTYSAYGTFTGTLAGVSSPATIPGYYSVVDGVVTIGFGATVLGGVSNGTTLSLSGIPAVARPVNKTAYTPLLTGVDNNILAQNLSATISTGGVITGLKGGNASGWTNGNSKYIDLIDIVYRLY